MPNTPKAWVGAPALSTPLDAPALIGLENRVANYVGAQEIGVGVGGVNDFRVTQQGGGSMSVNVGVAGVLMRAVLPGDGQGGTERYEYSGAQLNALVAAADPTNPRIDVVTLAPQASVDTNIPQVLIVKGTPTAGASFGNRLGAPALPAGRVWLADILVSAGATSILTGFIQDRRSYPFSGSVPASYVAIEQVTPLVFDIPAGVQTVTQGTNDNRAAAVQFWLPKRILSTSIRWKYRQGATAATTNYQWILFDPTGTRGLIASTPTAFSGAAASGHAQNDAWSGGPIQLEAGMYYMAWMTPGALNAGASISFNGWQGVQNSTSPGVPAPNMYAYSPVATIPGLTSSLPGAMFDAISALVDTNASPVPFFTLGA